MSNPSSGRVQLSPLHGDLRRFVLATGAFVIGLVLYAWRPIWLGPPYHAYTPILYGLNAQVWIPVWAYAIWRLPSRRLLVLLLSTFCLPLTCIMSLILAPQANRELLSMRNEDYGSLRHGGLKEQHCLLQDRIFTCELAHGSSDNDRVFYYVVTTQQSDRRGLIASFYP